MHQENTVKPSTFAHRTDYSLNHVYRLIKSGHVRAIKLDNGCYRIPESEVERVLGRVSGHE